MKQIFKFCKAKCCSNLALWKDSISNMLWYSFATSSITHMQWLKIHLNYTGSEAELKEKIRSIPHHCSNSHSFPNNIHHKDCSHGDLSGEDRQKSWLEDGSLVSHV